MLLAASRPITVLPTDSGEQIAISYTEIESRFRSPEAQRWAKHVQTPFIAKDPARNDASWDLAVTIPALLAAAGRRTPRMFQVAAGPGRFPIAMLALLQTERWHADHDQDAVFIWYVAAAPREALLSLGGPRLVGTATLDFALLLSLASSAEGRVWLHADPAGGDTLLDWYRRQGFVTVPRNVRTLPGTIVRPRMNDGRYLSIQVSNRQPPLFEELRV
jgi:hypothetical protein